ncbi:MAG: serine/threonine-protein kinase [Candidatus Melainabacteria bacterium]|nr:serine/threonine-protein kinase [Candidatus Melainabacteria bacterium]
MREYEVIDGRYRVDKRIGQGGMGQVFEGHDQVLDKTVAIKVLFPNTSDSVIKRFHAEAVALGQLKHPNILSVQHFGQSNDGVLYLVTDFIQGESLNDIIENRGAQTFFDVLPIFERICRGLRYAHANNVLHRDIKPSNVMLESDRSRDDSVKLVDFGLAKQADKDFELTKAGSAMGTPGYMSPEAIHGKEADERSDIYLWFYGSVHRFHHDQTECRSQLTKLYCALVSHLRQNQPNDSPR